MKCLLACIVLLVLMTGCALLEKSDPLVPRYFSPESVNASPHPESGTAPMRGLMLRLGRIAGGSYLKERIVFRDTDHELGFYEDRRWTERPEVYLQRALERSFFEERGVQRALGGGSPILTADLVEFEEVRGPHPRARIRVSYALHDDRAVLRESTFTVERPIAQGLEASQGERVAIALGEALADAVTQIVAQVMVDLAGQTAPARNPSESPATHPHPGPA